MVLHLWRGKCLLNHGVCPISTLYVYLAIYIRLCGRGFPFRLTRSPLRTAIEEALVHFHSVAPDETQIPGRDLLEVIFARFHFTHQHMAALCANFRSSLSCIGQVFACDEKSGYIRIVPQHRKEILASGYTMVCVHWRVGITFSSTVDNHCRTKQQTFQSRLSA